MYVLICGLFQLTNRAHFPAFGFREHLIIREISMDSYVIPFIIANTLLLLIWGAIQVAAYIINKNICLMIDQLNKIIRSTEGSADALRTL